MYIVTYSTVFVYTRTLTRKFENYNHSYTEVSLAGAIGGRSGERKWVRAGLELRPKPDADTKPVAEAGRSSNALVELTPSTAAAVPERRETTRSRSCPSPPASRSVLSEKSSMSAFRLAIVSFSRFERVRMCVRSASVSPCSGIIIAIKYYYVTNLSAQNESVISS